MTTLPSFQALPRRILLASNLTSRVDRALHRALELAREWDAALHVVHAVQELAPSVPPGVDREAYLRSHPDPKEQAARQLQREVGAAFPQARIHVEEDASPGQAILSVAERESCDLIVLGETRDRLFDLGEGTVDHVVRMSPVSVLAVRNRPLGKYRHLLVGSDFTDEAQQALVVAAGLFPDATITLMNVHSIPHSSLTEHTPEGREWATSQLAKLRAQIREADLPAARKDSIHPTTEAGPPGPIMRRYVLEHAADLTVIGAHPRGVLFDAVVGNSRRIVNAVPGDVLVVRAVRPTQ